MTKIYPWYSVKIFMFMLQKNWYQFSIIYNSTPLCNEERTILAFVSSFDLEIENTTNYDMVFQMPCFAKTYDVAITIYVYRKCNNNSFTAYLQFTTDWQCLCKLWHVVCFEHTKCTFTINISSAFVNKLVCYACERIHEW